ncbi:dihydrolipoyl dehydrogenase [Magnetovibrio blakemorei]|uniref:Dihydrolipoyl dehydrogenase n=1 Tax=Magnetovibrio blakemorei TaxID=28181 RepID=A0A1E5QB10_9PROT|nr:dihydrolipoyl dehydrogenase [Magnetovibrio blakemorei]OEJ69157.1 dihydrolipoyl dehydrogenase [Magnetovibrio blakemorei]
MAENAFDVIIIGGGPGGYVAAIRAAQLGFTTACVDMRETLGGTCLNVGCIPSKALLQSSHLFEEAGHGLAQHGVGVAAPKLDLKTMLGRKDAVVGDLTKGIAFLFKKNKITHIVGAGVISAPGKVKVGKDTFAAKHIIIATGSEPAPLAGVTIDEKQIVTSTGALNLPKVPKSMIVIGGGVIGLELGSVWRRLGADVTVVEFLAEILPGMDGEVVKQAARTFKKQGLNFKTGTKVTGAKTAKTGVTLTVEAAAGGKAETLKADVVLVSIGRRPFTDKLGLDKVGVEMDPRGFVKTDGHFKTNVEGIYAIGDVIGGQMLAHKAEEEGIACVEILAGQAGHVNYGAIPGVVYTHPEIAAVGKTEEALKSAGVAYTVGKFPFMANSRARAVGDTEGFVKILADAKTDRVLGAHIIGPGAGELIQEIVLAMEFGGASEDIARTSHAHPGTSEAVKEAALACLGRAIHI